MPGPSPHALIWSEQRQHYELRTGEQRACCFRSGDESAWQSWLDEHTAFAFVGKAGRLSVLKEARSRGAGYWYAYRTQARHTHKRYLGPTASVTFARLETVAKELTNQFSSAHKQSPQEEQASSVQAADTRREAPQPNTSSLDEQQMVFLSPKFSRPHLGMKPVLRERLLDELDAVRAHPLMLVSAPAGSGKTTLLSNWMALSSCREENPHTMGEVERNRVVPVVAWLSLDELDNEPIRFWSSIFAALRTCLPHRGHKALALLHSAGERPPLSTILMTLLQDLMKEDADIILILDDYHVISDQAIHTSLCFFLDHVPTNLHLILATRTDPELPLARFRVRSQLVEIRDQDLRFTHEEAVSFLRQAMSVPLSEAEMATLHQRTEGWIAGLQLAALSARKQRDLGAFVKEFAGSHRFLFDYVHQEILAQLPEMLQDFLLQTSILSRMNAVLCQAVTAHPTVQGCQEMLEALERANLFVMPLDDERQWYRFHDLFREALRARLQTSQPQLVSLLHRRAAYFFERAGEPREAIFHALAVPDAAYAATLMEQAAPLCWRHGEASQVYTWIRSLPDAVLCEHLPLALNATFFFLKSVNMSNTTLYAPMRTQVEQTLTKMEELLRRTAEFSLSACSRELIQRRLVLLRVLLEARLLVKLGDIERLLHLVEVSEGVSLDEDELWNVIPLMVAVWLTVDLKREGASLIPRLLATRQRVVEAGDTQVMLRVTCWVAMAATRAARWHLAHQEALSALALLEQIGTHPTMAGYLSACLFNASYAWNQLEEAAAWLVRLRQWAHDCQVIELLVVGEVLTARLALAKGDLSSAQQALHQLEALVEHEGFASHIADRNLLRVRVWLAEGNLDQAHTWAAPYTCEEGIWSLLQKEELVMVVRVLLEQQRYIQAEEILRRFSHCFDQQEGELAALEWMALTVVTLCHTGKREQAQEVLARLLTLTEPEHFMRVYLDAGSLMKQALKMLRSTSHSDDADTRAVSLSSITRVLAAFDLEEQQRTSERDASSASFSHVDRPSALHEPLTPSEQDVLRLLVSGKTYAEMAEGLIVSPNTIKTHVSSIYRKLDVNRRAEAIAMAARLHLL